MFNELITSFTKRPYVLAFLACYLFFAIRNWGVRRSIQWLVICYLVAWASEVSSIRTGIPYGWYSYVYENLQGELLIKGVPFFDSLSYVFLIYAGFGLAQRAWGDNIKGLIFGGALFTMLIDVITDPLATIGDRWFLGQIHTYKHVGLFFGVPITNFIGWYATAAAAISLNLFINRRPFPKAEYGPLILFVGVALFDIVIAYSIGAMTLATAQAVVLVAALRISFSPHFKA